jgi:hypothetical protein
MATCCYGAGGYAKKTGLGINLLVDLGLEWPPKKTRGCKLCKSTKNSLAALCMQGMGNCGCLSPRDRDCDPWGVFALSCLAFCSTPVSRWEASADPRHRLGKPFPYFQIFSGGVGAPKPLDWGIGDGIFFVAAQDPKEVGGAETGDESEDPFLCRAAEPDLGEDAHARSTLQGRESWGFNGMLWNSKEGVPGTYYAPTDLDISNVKRCTSVDYDNPEHIGRYN